MTKIRQKERERQYVERAIELLGVAWSIEREDERPDFLIATGPKKFGLEVVETFRPASKIAGQKSGSRSKWREAQYRDRIDNLRQKFESTGGIRLKVQIVGHLRQEHETALLGALTEVDFGARELGEIVALDIGSGLKVSASKSLAAGWFGLKDETGWVHEADVSETEKIIMDKALDLPGYRSNAGDDVRLLIVANRRANSGKLIWSHQPPVDARGFGMVYFLSFPEEITAINLPRQPGSR